MPPTLPEPPMTTPTGPGRAAVELAHRLLQRPAGEADLPELLGEVREAFAATSAGLAAWPDGQPIFVVPPPAADAGPIDWPSDAALLGQARHAPGAAGLIRGDGRRLVAPLTAPGGGTWVLWLDDAKDDWADAELAALALVGAAVAARLGAAGGQWAELLDRVARQERLEIAASATRRLAHDFGNALTGILGFTELALGQNVPANTPLGTYLQEVYRAAQTGAQFTHLLRLFSRRQSASSRGSQLATVLAEQEARLFAANPNGVTLRLNVPADLPGVGLDPEHLHHVLTAILDNAQEALVGPGSISVSARAVELTDAGCRELFGNAQPGPHVEIVIADTGIGLSPEAQKRLFAEPFFTNKPRRRGFGLAVAYGVLHAHRGGLRLYPGEERGVVVRVLVPLAPALVGEDAVRPSERLRGERVLVVDDEAEVLQFVRAILERAGYRVEVVSSGESALEAYSAATTDPFRLVLSDVAMPGLNGVDLARRLLRKDPQARVLFMSGHVTTDLPQADLAAHAFEMLAKPFRTEQLLRAVQSNIERASRGRLGGVNGTKK